ncbi:MAG: hypothetical protein H5T69_11275 [Chloroflexi bacterium]|nr:hypothetical protein [Chloroflexota bacterium]
MIQILVIALVGLLVYMAIGDDVSRIFRRRAEGYRLKYRQYITRDVVVPTVVLLVLGLFMRDVILTGFLWVLAAGVAYFRIRQVIARKSTITPRQVTQLVIAFRGAYQLQPAAFASLEQAAAKVDEPLKSLVNNVVNVFFTTSEPERAYAEFRKRTNSPLLNQFVYILEMSESASDESVTEALDAFVQRLRRQEELQREVETGLASVTGQTSFMQVLAVAIAFVVALVPGFRRVYTGGILGRVAYIILVTVIVGASYLIERKVTELKEQVL